MNVLYNGPTFPPFAGLLYTILIAVLTTLSACAGSGSDTSQTNPDMKTLKTSVFYRERMMLPPGSIVSVTLEDVSRMDTTSEILSKVAVETTGGPPYQVAIKYDPAAIKEIKSYNLRAQIQNGEQLLFSSTERIDPFRPQGNDHITIMLQKIAESKTPTKPDSTLTNTSWKLDMLLGKTMELGADGKELYMVLESENNRVRGFSGCNNFSGSFKLEDKSLHFGQIISTQMACMEGMEQELSFLQTLSTADYFKITADELLIYNNSGEPVIRFTARYLQ